MRDVNVSDTYGQRQHIRHFYDTQHSSLGSVWCIVMLHIMIPTVTSSYRPALVCVIQKDPVVLMNRYVYLRRLWRHWAHSVRPMSPVTWKMFPSRESLFFFSNCRRCRCCWDHQLILIMQRCSWTSVKSRNTHKPLVVKTCLSKKKNKWQKGQIGKKSMESFKIWISERRGKKVTNRHRDTCKLK